MSHYNYNQPYQPQRGFYRSGGQSGYSNSHQDWTNDPPGNYANFASDNWWQEYDQSNDNLSQQHLERRENCPAQFEPQVSHLNNWHPRGRTCSNNWHPQREHTYPRGNHTYQPQRGNHKHQSKFSVPFQPYIKPKEDWDRDIISNKQNPQSQTCYHTKCGNNQPKFSKLHEKVKSEEPYSRSRHEVQGVWVKTESNDILGITSKRVPNPQTNLSVDVAVNNSSTELGQNSNQAKVIDLTNDSNNTAPRQVENSIKQGLQNKENNNVDNIVFEPNSTQEVSQTKKTTCVSNANLQVPVLIFRKSSTNNNNWTIEKSIVSNGVRSASTESCRTDMTENSNISENNHLKSIDVSNHTGLSLSSNPASVAKDLISNQSISVLPENQPEKQHEILSRCERVLIKASFLDAQSRKEKVNKPGPLSTKSHSYVEEHTRDVSTQQNALPLISSGEERGHASDSPSVNEDVVVINTDNDINSSDDDGNSSDTIIDENSCPENSSSESDNSTSSSESDNSTSSSESDNSTSSNESYTSISSRFVRDHSSMETSGSECNKSISSTDEMSSLCSKRKSEDDIFIHSSKRPRTISENEEDNDVIVISDDETCSKDVNETAPSLSREIDVVVCKSTVLAASEFNKKLNKPGPLSTKSHSYIENNPSTLNNSSTSNIKSTIQNNVKQKVTAVNLNPQKTSNKKSLAPATSAPETSRKCLLTNNSCANNNTSSHHKFSAIKSTNMVEAKKSLLKKPVTSANVKEVLPISNLPSQQEGKLKRLINRKKPIVLLQRLTQKDVKQFSVFKNIVDKNSLVYRKDAFCQLKYFISFIEHWVKDSYKVSLTAQVDDPKDLCNTGICYFNENHCVRLEIKYLHSEHGRITYKTLSNPEFDIRKLYKDFLDFRKSSIKKLNLFIICTNLDVNIDAFEHNRIAVKRENNKYGFTVEEGHELHKKFVKCLSLHNLAELLFQCIEQKKQKNFNTELIKKYHLALVKENVLTIHIKRNFHGRLIRVARFHPDFVRKSGLSNGAKELRCYLTKFLHSEPQPSMEFELTSEIFGKDIHLDPNPQVEVLEVADALVNREAAKLQALKSELQKITGHVLEKEENNIFGFSKQFFRGTDLLGNLKQLKRQVAILCDHHKIGFQEFCNSKIFIKDFCNDHLVQKLPDENGKKLFKEFFNCFRIENIKNCHLLDEDISKINDKSCANDVQEELFTAFEQENLSEETFISIKNLISKHKIIRTYKQQQPKINIEFDKKVLDTLQGKLPKRGIVLCVTKCLSLTSLKVKQLTDKLNYKEDIESLFITNKILLKMTSNVLKALAHKSTRLLVVQWNDPMERSSQVLNVFNKLVDLIEKQRVMGMKSVIIIVHQKHCSSVTNFIRFTNKITDDEHSFDLSEDSRVKLLQLENISLQHRKLSLVKAGLILDKHVPILLESTEILRYLLTGKLSIGKDLVRPCGYKESLFKTQIKQCIVIDPSIFREQIEDVFIIRNIHRKNLEQYLPPRQKVLSPNDVPASMRINARYILLGFNIPPSFFDDYAEKNQEHSVHLLRYESGSFVWEKTSGNNKDLLRNKLEDIGDLLKSQKTVNVVTEGPKTVIICGESGSGKSVCMYNLARETKNLYRTESVDAYWPVQVNLDKLRLSKYIRQDVNIALEKDFVAKFLCSYLELDEVQSKLMSMIFQNQLKIKLALFFDNYEELPPSHREFVIELMQELQVSYCEKIYVTSTPSVRSQLENALAVFAYTLEFSEVEKIQFLQSFWSNSLGDIEFTNEADYFIDHYCKTESNDDDLTRTPLHLKMLAGMYEPNSDDYTSVEDHDELYKLYVEHKGVKDEESAKLYSLHKILNEDQLKTLNLQHKHPKKGFTLPEDLRHRTFYEYFSAKWLATHDNSLTIASCINSLLDSVSPLFLKSYMAQLDASDDMVKLVGNFAENGHLNAVKTMLTHCRAKLLLTSIIRSNNPKAREVVRFLLDHYNDTKEEVMLHGDFKETKYAESNVVKYVNRREKPKKETALEVAARTKNVQIACELLLKGASIKGIDENFVFDVARYVADEMCKTDSAWLHPIAEKLFKLQPDAVDHLDKIDEYPRLLSYFFTHGRVQLVNLLLKNDRARYNVLVAKVNGKSPLDLVNDSRAVSDDERLEIAKYIVSNVGEDLERKNKYYLGDVLKTAAECNHERTFEYFVGKFPGKHMGFLTSAMKMNRLDLIRFLMRKTDRMMYPEGDTALHKAVSLGVSPITIKFLVNRGGIDNKNKSGETPLCVAFKEGKDLELVKYLIKRDAHLFAKDELGLYPWCHAILDDSKYTAEEQMHIMKFLVQAKVKLKAPETEEKISFESDQKRKQVARKLKFFQKPQGFMPNLELYIALKSNDDSWIRFLILHGANVNHKEADGRTPLHIAIEFKRYKLVKMLLDHGAMFNAKDKQKTTPLKLLLASGDECTESKEVKELLEMAKKLFDGSDKYLSRVSRHLINCRDKQGQTLLHVAAKSGNKDAVKNLIKNSKDYCIDNKDFPQLDVNAKDATGQTPLDLVKNHNVDVAKELLASGAIFEPATTPLLQYAKKLIQAVKDKDVERVKELIKNDCLVNARDESGKSCLHWAASFDCREIMEIVLAARAIDVDATDLNLQTPLHYATENDNIACVVLLLKAGASYDVRNKQGDRPFDAIDGKNESVKLMKKIHESFLDIKSDEPRILVHGNPDALVEYLAEIDRTWHVSKDVVVNVVDSKKNTLLHTATRFDFISIVESLLRQGVIYNRKNKWKKSPESMAISSKQLFKNLYEAKQNLSVSSWANLDPELVVNFRFDNGYTLLRSCVNEGKKEEVRWLIENGADVRATSNRGSKIWCDKKKYPEIFELLDQP